MTNWNKAPRLIRDIRIGYMIPELRYNVAIGVVLYVAKWAVFIPTLVIATPFFLLLMLAEYAVKPLECIIGFIGIPSQFMQRAVSSNIRKTHEIKSVEEIREIVYGEQVPHIIPKTARRETNPPQPD